VRLRPFVFAALLFLLSAPRAEAACTVSSTGVSFSPYDVFSTTANTGNGTITYNCGNKDKNVEIDLSAGSSGSFVNRTLTQGANTLTYNLYTDAAFGTVWGDTSGGTGVYTKTNPPNGLDVNVPVYGRISAQQDASAGAYTDTIVATVNF
jgi:spore coat protein U-like protein